MCNDPMVTVDMIGKLYNLKLHNNFKIGDKHMRKYLIVPHVQKSVCVNI